MYQEGNLHEKFGIDCLKTVACRRVRKFKKRHSSTVEATPRSPGGSDPPNFFAYFFLGLGHDSGKFSDRYLEKKFGEKISPRGVRPPKFLEGDCIPPRVMCLQSFIAIALKLWPVDVRKTRGGTKIKKTDFRKSRENRKSERSHPYTIEYS